MKRALPIGNVSSLSLVCAILLLPASLLAADKHWNAIGQGRWSEADKWVLPGVPAAIDNAFVGTLPGVVDETVFMDEDVTVSNLVLDNGMGLQTSIHCCGDDVVGNKLTVFGVTSIGTDARLVIYNAGAGIDFESDTLNVLDNFALLRSSQIRLGDELRVSATAAIRGTGSIQLAGNGTTLTNDGDLSHDSGNTTYTQLNGGSFDLDGLSGNGEVSVGNTVDEDPDAVLVFSGGGLTDAFSGTIQLGPNAMLDMSVGPWTADANSTIDVWFYGAAPRILTGDQVTLAGLLDVSYSAVLNVDADAVLASTANVDIAENAHVRFAAASNTVIEGGDFALGLESNIDFNGNTTLHGGTFHTHSDLSVEGAVRFGGDTDWDGNVTIDGIAMQLGDATVSGPTVVTADVLDMDGGGGTEWDINHSLVANLGSVDSSLSNTFDGVIRIGGGFVGNGLTMNLTGAFDEWTMAGEMNLSGMSLASFPLDRLHGSPMRVTGDVNVEHRVRVSADVTFENSSVVSLDEADTRLQLTGRTTVKSNATFTGDGILENGSTGELILADSASLGGVGLTNRGLLEIGNSAGTASVDRFASHASGTWLVELGGILPSEFDRLLMGGAATLAGALEVDLIDAGDGLFLPEVGDTFTILTALGGVSGTFDNNPISSAAGRQFHWNVIYTPNDVILELASIAVPEPASVAQVLLTGTALVAAARRRRRGR